MKKIITIIMLCVFSQAAYIYKDYNQAVQAAKNTNKILVVTAYADSCRYCHQMLNSLTRHPYFNQFTQDYIYAVVNIKDNLELFVKQLGIEVTPTTYFFNPKHLDYYIPEIKGVVELNSLIDYLNKIDKYFKNAGLL